MRRRKYLEHVVIVVAAALVTGARMAPGAEARKPAPKPFAVLVAKRPAADTASAAGDGAEVSTRVRGALEVLAAQVGPLSHPEALRDAFRGYFAFLAARPGEVRKPYLYFVDYGQPNTAKRGWVFDMKRLAVVEGPFTVAHGRGSAQDDEGTPTRFSNRPGSAATSLGLYVAQELYQFHGTASGGRYTSTGLRMQGVSSGWNDNARMRRVVAHGAPYVTPEKAGRSEGCPAMEPARARRLLPRLADGGLVFLFAPDEGWLAGDPWVGAGSGAA